MHAYCKDKEGVVGGRRRGVEKGSTVGGGRFGGGGENIKISEIYQAQIVQL